MFKSATVDRASAKSSNPSPFHTKNGRDTFIQPKLNIGKANDKCEVEADAVADRVVYKTNASKQSNFLSPASTFINHTLQKKEEVDDLQESSIASNITPVTALSPVEDESVQKKPKETNQEQQEEDLPRSEKDTDEDIQTKMETSNPLNFDISQRLQEARGNGRPLSTPVLKQMQNGFGANFGNVLIHTDAASITMNKDLGARAFTNRHHIFFNEGEYQPTTVEGQFLLAHELTHTIQQGAAKAKPTANSSVASDDLVDNLPPTVNTSSDNAVATNYFFTDTTAKETPVPIDSQETQTLAQEPVVTESLDTAPPETETEIAHAEEEAAFPQSAEEDPAFNALQNRVEQTAAHHLTSAHL